MSIYNSRRDFIIRLASVSAAVSAGGVLSACGGAPDPVRFDYGVASGDPLADRVMLWTHAKTGDFLAPSDPVLLTWEVARDAAFSQVVSSGQAVASEGNGFTVKVDAGGLIDGTSYFYRFRSDMDSSPVGRTRTLPERSVSRLKLAVFSCSNYPAGFFHAYSEAVRAGAEYAIHLGDYIYEYGIGGYASADAVALGRVSEPIHELLSLADYRRRYAQYRSDPDLKHLHASMPMIAVWDDHEVANNTYVDGAENHTEGVEGTFSNRVAAALKAYHEWLPIRTPDPTNLLKIYRSFDFGQLVSLHMLETRLLGRAKQIGHAELLDPARAAGAIAALSSPLRQMLGAEQQSWLTRQLGNSSAIWQVLGQPVLMARMEFPASVLQALNPENISPEAQAAGAKAIQDYLIAKATAAQNPAALTPAQQALLDPQRNPRLGYNLDAWDGYPAAREILLATVAALRKRVISLAGDTHNAWHSDLTLMNGTKVGEEFATSSVSSPGLEEALKTLLPTQTAVIFRGVVDTLRYANTEQRGFLLMEFSARAATGTWHLLDTVKASPSTVRIGHTADYLV